MELNFVGTHFGVTLLYYLGNKAIYTKPRAMPSTQLMVGSIDFPFDFIHLFLWFACKSKHSTRIELGNGWLPDWWGDGIGNGNGNGKGGLRTSYCVPFINPIPVWHHKHSFIRLVLGGFLSKEVTAPFPFPFPSPFPSTFPASASNAPRDSHYLQFWLFTCLPFYALLIKVPPEKGNFLYFLIKKSVLNFDYENDYYENQNRRQLVL